MRPARGAGSVRRSTRKGAYGAPRRKGKRTHERTPTALDRRRRLVGAPQPGQRRKPVVAIGGDTGVRDLPGRCAGRARPHRRGGVVDAKEVGSVAYLSRGGG